MWTLTVRLDDVYITDIVYLLDVLVVIVYMSYCNCWDYLLLHEDWGECSEDWAGACRWGGGEVEYLTEKKISLRVFFPTKFFFLKNVPGVLKRMQAKIYFSGGGGDFGVFGAPHAPTRGSRGVGKRYTSSYDHDMWAVKILERSGLAVKSYHPETLKKIKILTKP